MFVEASRQMVITGDWITPYWNDSTRFDKPPLIYWLMAICFKIFGINEMAARLPSAIFAFAVVMLVYYTIYFVVNSQGKNSEIFNYNHSILIATIGGLITILNPAWIAWARTGVSDMLLSSNISLALLSFFLGYSHTQNQKKIKLFWYFSFYCFCGLAVLTKGPVGLLLPIVIITSFLLYVKQLKPVLKEIKLPWGILLFLLITIPWFVAITLTHGSEYLNTFFGLHNFQRYVSVVSNHRGSWYYFFPVLFVGLIPWSCYLPLAIYRLKFWQRTYYINQSRSKQIGLFALIWLGVIFTFFSISVTKLPSYILPVIPAETILITLMWQEIITKKIPSFSLKIYYLTALFNLIILISLALASFNLPNFLGDNPLTPDLQEALNLSPSPLIGLLLWLIITILSIFLLLNNSKKAYLWLANALGFLIFIPSFLLPNAKIYDFHAQLPLRNLALTINQIQQPQEKILLIGFIRPSLVFYTRQPINFFNSIPEAITYLNQQNLNQNQSCLIIAQPQIIQELNLAKNSYTILDKQGVYKLIRLKLNK
jgi:4-amino-4-deoxy-L-arabinose transferase-like glycosyltransferase